MSLEAEVTRRVVQLEPLTRAQEFCQVGKFLLAGGNTVGAALRMAQIERASPRVLEALRKTAVAPATITDSTWAGPLAQPSLLEDGFLESLRNLSAFDRLLSQMFRMPPEKKIGVITAGAVGAAVGEGMVTPVARLSTAAPQMDPLKALCLVVLAQELMQMAGVGAIALLQRELAGAVAQVVDTAFVAALTTGLTPIPSAGATALAVRADMRAAVDAISSGAASSLVWLTTSQIQNRLAVLGDSTGSSAFPELASGKLGIWPLVVSDGVPAGQLILADAHQVGAFSGPVELDPSNVADIDMSTVPDSPALPSTTKFGLWQMNYVALKCVRYFGCKRLTDTAVAVISNATAIGNSPS